MKYDQLGCTHNEQTVNVDLTTFARVHYELFIIKGKKTLKRAF